MVAYDRISRALGLAAPLSTSDTLHPSLLGDVSRALHRHGEGYVVAGFLIAVLVTVLFAVLFDD